MATDRKRAVVKTFVSPEMKEEWREHADDLDMSQSEFVQAMVQAGRRKIDLTPEKAGSTVPEDDTPGVDGHERRVLELLDEGEYRSWEELVERVTADIEDRLEETLEELQAENRVLYSGRNGGYTLVGET